MTDRRVSTEQYAAICDLLHQAICERMEEPDTDPTREFFTGEVERAFATAICDALDLDPTIHCALCDGDAEGYMVHDEVWQAAGLEKEDGWVCLACLTQRLARKLRPADFTPDAGLNDWIWGTLRPSEEKT